MISEHDVWDAIRKTIRRFRTQPDLFFTEADIVAYFYHALYGKNAIVRPKSGPAWVQCVHLEYPTRYRYERERAVAEESYDPTAEQTGKRGWHDVVVLNPAFVAETPLEVVINKNNSASNDYRRSQVNEDESGPEEALSLEPSGPAHGSRPDMLFAIEFKYVISSSAKFVKEVRLDNWKLDWTKRCGSAVNVVNLVFCKTPDPPEGLEVAIQNAPSMVVAVLIQSMNDGVQGHVTPKPRTNCFDAGTLSALRAIHF